ncbi:hypothetical protein LCGC14_2306620 [marine sediment metagenome]|uniref:Uncharacterized protein n=1 Tax=marine sediment metagenome TaxID=412755 RepID=A0A0F9EZA9_9ZZZZ
MSELTKKELATWVILGDPYIRMIPSPLSELHARIVRALIMQEENLEKKTSIIESRVEV